MDLAQLLLHKEAFVNFLLTTGWGIQKLDRVICHFSFLVNAMQSKVFYALLRPKDMQMNTNITLSKLLQFILSLFPHLMIFMQTGDVHQNQFY